MGMESHLSLLTGSSRSDQAGYMDVQEAIHSLVNQSSARTVYGEPITADGKTIVPIAKVRYGFGGGSGRRSGGDAGEGGGGGGGATARPVGYIEVSADGTRFVPIVDLESVSIAVGMGILLGLVLGRVSAG
jgi:uncharacterized spore protein YtfJ